jgi:tetratricopeptide (TPR) repeat protein
MNAFSECLYRDPENIGGLLGYGITCRSIHFENHNEQGLLSALKTFETVAQKKGYHVAEALFHMGTIYIALEKWRDAELITRKSIALRETGAAKRNLVIALYEQGRTEDARSEYLRLKQKYPEETAGLDDIFSK